MKKDYSTFFMFLGVTWGLFVAHTMKQPPTYELIGVMFFITIMMLPTNFAVTMRMIFITSILLIYFISWCYGNFKWHEPIFFCLMLFSLRTVFDGKGNPITVDFNDITKFPPIIFETNIKNDSDYELLWSNEDIRWYYNQKPL